MGSRYDYSREHHENDMAMVREAMRLKAAGFRVCLGFMYRFHPEGICANADGSAVIRFTYLGKTIRYSGQMDLIKPSDWRSGWPVGVASADDPNNMEFSGPKFTRKQTLAEALNTHLARYTGLNEVDKITETDELLIVSYKNGALQDAFSKEKYA